MKAFDYLTNLRSELIMLLSGVKNSTGHFGWDNTIPNWATKLQLEALIEKYVTAAKDLGIYVITCYSSCDNPKHVYYTTQNRYGLNVPYLDPKFIWNGDQLFQGFRESVCPCTATNRTNKNGVIDFFVYDPNANLKECRAIGEILNYLHRGLHHTGRNQARSGVREILLSVMLRIHDAILPQTMDEYILEVRAKL